MALTKIDFANASPRGTGDNRLASVPAKARHFNDLVDGVGYVATLAHFTGITTLSAAATLAKNTIYHVTDTDAATYTLPKRADSKAGDTIKMLYIAAVGNGETQVYAGDSSDETFTVGSAVIRTTGATGSATGLIKSVDVSVAADYRLNVVGLTNGGPGIGSTITFTYNGTSWGCNAHMESSGTGIAANLSVFA
jgi:hypothetical protein|tara:strand:+ start:9890 stop:10471 length:582 start_codon:yes stop_codon:yes gene_type:complete